MLNLETVKAGARNTVSAWAGGSPHILNSHHPSSYPNTWRGSACPWNWSRNSHQPYPSPERILEHAVASLPFNEGFEDLCVQDLVWAHTISTNHHLEHSNFDNIPSFTGLLRRGLRDWEHHKGRNTMLEESMQYTACVGAMSLSYCNKLGRKVSPVFHSHSMRKLTQVLVEEGIREDCSIGAKDYPDGMRYAFAI